MRRNMKVSEIMTKNPVLVSPEASLEEAAEKMKEVNCGILPVGTRTRLEGVITDRDIVIRGLASGMNPAATKVRRCMSADVRTCLESATLKEAADMLYKHNVSRLVVQDIDGKLTGIISFGCILRKGDNFDEVTDVVAHAVRKFAA